MIDHGYTVGGGQVTPTSDLRALVAAVRGLPGKLHHHWRHLTWPWRLRIALRDRDLIAGLRKLRSIDPTHGDCPVCGKHLTLNADGRLRRHGNCPGGGELPAREEVAH